MKTAPLPRDEAERLAELRRYEVLDSLPDAEFDSFTLLASQICHVPIALISLVDRDRQWFKSKQGLDACQTGRDVAFCAHAILEDEVLVVRDALKDERFRDNPLVLGPPHVRFYAGAPLITPSGHRIGTLCVIDSAPREVSSDQINGLKALARLVVSQLELRIQIESARRSAQVLNNCPAPIFCKDYGDGKGTFIEWNSSAERLWGLARGAVIGKTDADFFPPDQAEFFRQKDLETLRGGVPLVIEREPIETPNGKMDLRTWKVPLLDGAGRARYLLGISLDITSQTELERQLIEAKKSAERAAQTKAAFLANMSHEIRTPMNGIIGMSNLILGSLTDVEQIERVRIIQSCGHSLLEIINDVLDFSKLEADKIELECVPFSLLRVVKDIVDLLSPRAEEKGISLEFFAPRDSVDVLRGDPTRLRQVLTNLIANSIKFTEKGGIEVRWECKNLTGKNHEIHFSVSDTGIGIPEHLTGKLFQSFSQVDASTTRRFGGSGLGLAICKGLCEKMGGRIWASSQIGKGSKFSFSIVAPGVENGEALPAESSEVKFLDPEMGKRHPLEILIVEDNHTNQLVALGLLGKLGYRADVAYNGFQALEALHLKKYNLVLMDCHMPEMDGFDATKRIIAEYGNAPRPRIVALSASTMHEDVERCRAAGMDEFLGKPISLSALVKTLSRCQPKSVSTKTVFESAAQADPPADGGPTFNATEFWSSFAGLEDVALDAIQKFCQNLPAMVGAIESAAETPNAKALELAAHSLKGALSNFYARPCQDISYSLEKMGRDNQLGEAASMLDQLKKELVRLEKDLVNSASSRMKKAA